MMTENQCKAAAGFLRSAGREDAALDLDAAAERARVLTADEDMRKERAA